jgi:hypothetical protein
MRRLPSSCASGAERDGDLRGLPQGGAQPGDLRRRSFWKHFSRLRCAALRPRTPDGICGPVSSQVSKLSRPAPFRTGRPECLTRPARRICLQPNRIKTPAFRSRERKYRHRRTSLGELGSDLRYSLRPGISNLPMRKHRRASGLNTSNEVDEALRNREVLPL